MRKACQHGIGVQCAITALWRKKKAAGCLAVLAGPEEVRLPGGDFCGGDATPRKCFLFFFARQVCQRLIGIARPA